LRLSPFDPLSFLAYHALGNVRVRDQRYDDAASYYAKAVQVNPRFSWLFVVQTAALAQAGRLDEAKAVARRVLELEPTFRIRPIMQFAVFVRPELVSAISGGLRLAGLPEQHSGF
jgi:adenylate cyclase